MIAFALAASLLALAGAAEPPRTPAVDPFADTRTRRRPDAMAHDAASEAFAAGEAAFAVGDFAAAAARFERAQKLSPHPATLFNLALSRRRAGDDVGAYADFRALSRLASDPFDRDFAEAQMADLLPRVAVVAIRSRDPVLVCVDGQRVRPTFGHSLHEHVTTPGEHTLEVEGRSTRIRLRGGETRHLDLDLAARLRPPPPRAPTRAWLATSIATAVAATGLGIGAAVADDGAARPWAIASGATAGIAATSAILALVLRPERRRPPRPTACSPTQG